MSVRGFKWRLTGILITGFALGAIGLLEPLTRFWRSFEFLGLSWYALLGLYFAAGLVVALIAALAVELVARSAFWLPVTIAGYYPTAAACLAGAFVLTPTIRNELASFELHIPTLVILVLLLAAGALITFKAAPRIIVPVFRRLFGCPDGRISEFKLLLAVSPLLLVVLLTAFETGQARRDDAGRPARAGLATRPSGDAVQNVLLITIDALREDHLGVAGYARPTTPALDAFARDAVVFDRCFAQGNATELSFGSLFTSLYPHAHGVRRHQNRASPLVGEIETLAEKLRDAGLRTEGLMTNPFLQREWGLTQGFDEVDEFRAGYLELLPARALKKIGLVKPPELIPLSAIPRGRVVVDRAIARLERLRARPFFLFVHLMDAHNPYIPPEPYDTMFSSHGANMMPAPEFWQRVWPVYRALPSDRERLAQPDLDHIVDLYDGAIRYADHEVGRLLEALARLGLERNTLVVVTSEHGEEFLEHGNISHRSPLLYDELIHVPLIVRLPGAAGGRHEEALVRHVDLLPTILALFHLPEDAAEQGTSLMPLLTGAGAWHPVPAFSQSYRCISVRTDDRKLMLDLVDDRGFCFDLRTDPGELHNLYGPSAPCDSLEGLLLDYVKKTLVTPPGGVPREIDQRTRSILGSLGYVAP